MNNSFIKQGNCLELMKEIPDESIDLVITDPPYEINTSGGGCTNKKIKGILMNLIS